MSIKQRLFIVMAFCLLLFPSLLFASREEVMNETLRKLELASSEEAAEESSSIALNKSQAIYGARRYQDAKEKLGKDSYPIKRGIPASSLPQSRVRGGAQPVGKNWKFIPQRILRIFSPKAEPVEENLPASGSLQDYYTYVLEKYRKAKDKEESEKESFFAPKEDFVEKAEKTKRIRYVSGGYNANHMHYKETIGKRTLDEDYGKLKGFYLEAGYRDDRYVPWLMGRPFIEGYYRRYDALITYDGASSLGPLSFKERAEVHRYGIKAGTHRDFSKKGELFGYFDLGKRIWYRGENEVIQGVLTYAEKYWWVYYGLGVGINYKILPNISCGVDLEAMTTHRSQRKMRADLYEGATFHLGDVYGTEIKVPLKYYFLENASFDLTPYFTYWKIHASDTQLISGSYYYEPDSTTHIEGVLVGLSYLF